MIFKTKIIKKPPYGYYTGRYLYRDTFFPIYYFDCGIKMEDGQVYYETYIININILHEVGFNRDSHIKEKDFFSDTDINRFISKSGYSFFDKDEIIKYLEKS